MVQVQDTSKRKPSGGRIKLHRKKKRLSQIMGDSTMTKLGAVKRRTDRQRSVILKFRLQTTDTANVLDPKTKKYKIAKIKTILESPSNRHYVRRNIMTKGTVIDTDLGKAKITSRPGQDGMVNAVLL